MYNVTSLTTVPLDNKSLGNKLYNAESQKAVIEASAATTAQDHSFLSALTRAPMRKRALPINEFRLCSVRVAS
jgi:hypothetical protein